MDCPFWCFLCRCLGEASGGKRWLDKATNWFSVEKAQTLHGQTAYLFSIDESKDHDLFRKNTAHLFSTEISQEGKRTLLEHTAFLIAVHAANESHLITRHNLDRTCIRNCVEKITKRQLLVILNYKAIDVSMKVYGCDENKSFAQTPM